LFLFPLTFIFGGVKKKNERYNRQSCVYNTPEEVVEGNVPVNCRLLLNPKECRGELRRVVLNPFRKQHLEAEADSLQGNAKKPAKDIGDIGVHPLESRSRLRLGHGRVHTLC